MAETRVNCYTCRFFYVTWDPALPYGCRGMGFKTKQLPSVVVYSSSGRPCQMYQKKKDKPGPAR